MSKNLVGMKAIAGYLGVSYATIIDWYNSYGLPIKKTKLVWVGSAEKIDEWFAEFSENQKKASASR